MQKQGPLMARTGCRGVPESRPAGRNVRAVGAAVLMVVGMAAGGRKEGAALAHFVWGDCGADLGKPPPYVSPKMSVFGQVCGASRGKIVWAEQRRNALPGGAAPAGRAVALCPGACAARYTGEEPWRRSPPDSQQCQRENGGRSPDLSRMAKHGSTFKRGYLDLRLPCL
jgi:hypothetical protein